MGMLADTYLDATSYDLAEVWSRRAYDIYQIVHSYQETESSIARLITLAASLVHLQRTEEAEKNYLDCVTARAALFGNAHSLTHEARNFLSSLYFIQERYDKAEKVYREMYEIRLDTVELSDLKLFQTTMSIWQMCLKQFKYLDAEPFLKTCLQVQVEMLGLEHPATVYSTHTLFAIEKFREFSEILGSAPTEVQISHEPHVLLLKPSVYDGQYGCDVCSQSGVGWVYACAECGTDVHPHCCLSYPFVR